jgi:hypothetical protein
MLQKILAFSIVFIVIHFSLASAQVNDTVDSSNIADPNIPTDIPDQTNSTATDQTDSTTDQTNSTTDQTDSTTDQTDSTTDQTDSTTDQTDSTTDQTDSTTDQTNSTTDQTDSTDQTNSTTDQTDSTAYTLPNSASVTAIIPTEVTTFDPTSDQLVSTPSFDKIIPGQEMIIQVTDSSIPSFGGIKEINVQSTTTATSVGGTAPDEWLAAEVDNKLPSSVSASNIKGTLVLFVNIEYPFEQNGVGFNWGDPDTHAKPPVLTLIINKTGQSVIQKDSVGCPIINAYLLSSGEWTNSGLGEISSSSISSTQCQVKIQSQHLSEFAFSLRHVSSSQSSGPGLFGVGTVVTGSTNSSLARPLDNGITNDVNATTYYKTIADPAEGFSNVECSRGSGYALMTGQYTSDAVPDKVVFLKMFLLDNTGHVMATGNGLVSDIDAHKTKSFNAIARFNEDFASCTIQTDNIIPK